MHFWDELLSVSQQSLTITLFVLSMMLIIEYINVFSRGIWSNKLKTSSWKQIIFAALLGVIPGCLGAYTAVSLYVHNIIGTAALVTAMIATSGDEAFFMFSIIPDTAIIINIVIFVIAIITGFLVNIFLKKNHGLRNHQEEHLEIHNLKSQCFCFNKELIIKNFRNISLQRLIVLVVLLITLLVLIISNHTGHNHTFDILPMPNMEHLHPEWVSYSFIGVIAMCLLMILTVNDHFLKHHLWGHIIKKHFLKIFIWTFATLILLNFLNHYIDLKSLIGDNIYLVLIIAVFIGIIPESGPHLMFVLLFASGSLPLSILIANSIVQDGHGSLPLLAETRKGFFVVKSINIMVGLLVGIIGILTGI